MTSRDSEAEISALLSSNLEEPLLPQSWPSLLQQDESRLQRGIDQNLRQQQPFNDPKNVTFSFCSRRCSINQNVLLTFILDALYGISESLWAGTVFAAYLKKIGSDKNGPVGDIEAVNGLAVLLTALPVGYLADRYGRSIVIRAGGILFVVTAICHIVVMEWIGSQQDDSSSKYNHGSATDVPMILLAIVMGMWGVGGGIVSGPCQALYADSTPAGERSKYYHYLFVVYLMASCIGPIISIILFQSIGNDWDTDELRTIIYVGLGLEFLNAVVMMCFDDSKALDEPQEDSDDSEEDAQPSAPMLQTRPDEEISQDHALTTEGDLPVVTAPIEDGDRFKHRQRWIPYILFVSSVIMSIGSGMTVKFFPLFFKDEVGMTPTQVQLIYVLVPVVMAMCSGLGTTTAAWFGRVQTSLLLQFAGISCLFAMVFAKNYLDQHPIVLVPVYVIRTALMNAPYPLQESILMDSVPKSERARWKSLESISSFGWCGSAALGGYLSDKWDYSFTFFITAIIQLVGTLAFGLLLPLVPKREQSLQSTTISPDETALGTESVVRGQESI